MHYQDTARGLFHAYYLSLLLLEVNQKSKSALKPRNEMSDRIILLWLYNLWLRLQDDMLHTSGRSDFLLEEFSILVRGRNPKVRELDVRSVIWRQIRSK